MTRVVWLCLGFVCVGLGSVGIVVPGLPTTIFFILAAWAFAKSNPRLEAWVLGLPRIGPLVVDYRAGLGMPRRAKVAAVASIVFFVSLSALLLGSWSVRGVVILAGLVGVATVVVWVPTRETVLAARDS